MSTHSNQARINGPTATRKAIRGNNPTYKTAVQKAGSAHATIKNAGHYIPNK